MRDLIHVVRYSADNPGQHQVLPLVLSHVYSGYNKLEFDYYSEFFLGKLYFTLPPNEMHCIVGLSFCHCIRGSG